MIEVATILMIYLYQSVIEQPSQRPRQLVSTSGFDSQHVCQIFRFEIGFLQRDHIAYYLQNLFRVFFSSCRALMDMHYVKYSGVILKAL